MCNKWPNFPNGVSGVTGGLIGDTVVICGGYNIDECYSLTSEKATLVTHMSVGRLYTASIVLNDNTLWVTGGYNTQRQFLQKSFNEVQQAFLVYQNQK